MRVQGLVIGNRFGRFGEKSQNCEHGVVVVQEFLVNLSFSSQQFRLQLFILLGTHVVLGCLDVVAQDSDHLNLHVDRHLVWVVFSQKLNQNPENLRFVYYVLQTLNILELLLNYFQPFRQRKLLLLDLLRYFFAAELFNELFPQRLQSVLLGVVVSGALGFLFGENVNFEQPQVFAFVF